MPPPRQIERDLASRPAIAARVGLALGPCLQRLGERGPAREHLERAVTEVQREDERAAK